MQTLQLDKVDFQLKQFDVPSEDHFKTLIKESTIIKDTNGQTQIAYVENAHDLSLLFSSLKTIRYEETGRTNGLPTISRVFGYQPRIAIRRDFCTATKLNSESPDTFDLLKQAAMVASNHYKETNPGLHEVHMEMMEKILPNWRISEGEQKTPFTSGIINKNNQLRYHYDSGNFKNVWSAMFVMKGNVDGGYISIPEYNIGFELANNSLFLFDGQSILHGVTPIKMNSMESYRISVVYYSLAGMWKCLEPKEELARIRKVKTLREEKRAV
jgi:hypothetical protein